ncbi:MAG: hypothetical protein HRT88_01100 [Lentisphaeraceae bacterium]|nr:hypothetical protein [Lentisphaeraceae bacterium]
MNYSIENVREDFTSEIDFSAVFDELFGMPSDHSVIFCQGEDGEVYFFTRQQNSSGCYNEFNPEICAIQCGWSLQDEVINDDDYFCDDETGKWGIKGQDDISEYVKSYFEYDNLVSQIEDRIEMKKQDHYESIED